MRMVFGPDDEKAFFEARDELVERFAAWADDRVPDADPWIAQLALDYKWGYADGELGRWTRADLHDLLLDWFPRKVTLDPDSVEQVVPTMRAFLDWLALSDLLDRSGERPRTLRTALDRLAPKLPGALADPSRFGLAKSFAAAMQAGEVDIGDKAAVDRFVTGFNELPVEERERLVPALGALPFGPPPAEEPPPPALPPIRLAPEAELAEAAAAAPAVERLRRVVTWVGDGRKLTQKGNPTLADGKALAQLLGAGDQVDPKVGDRVFPTRSSAELPEVALAFAWAKAARLVRVVHGRVVPVKRSQGLLGRPLDLWQRAFEGFRQLGPPLLGDRILGSFLVEGFDEAVIGLLMPLYVSDEPVSFDQLVNLSWDHLRDAYYLDGAPPDRLAVWRQMTAADLDRALGQLELLGAVERSGDPGPGPVDEDLRGVPSTLGFAGEEAWERVRFRLTPLGAWGTNRLLREHGVDAPVVGDLAAEDAATLLDRCGDYDEESCQAELAAWCAARGPAAATELAAFVRSSDDPAARMLAFAALDLTGPDGVDEVRRLREDERLRPYATMWLVEHGLEDQGALDPEAAVRVMVETFAVTLATEGPAGAIEMLQGLGPADEQAALIGNLWRVDSPHVAELLDAVATSHPDKGVAKAARKATFKLRSSPRR
jgi:hypothetical protein